MKINLNGSFDLNAGFAESFAFLADPKKLSSCVADIEGTKFIDDHTFDVILTVKLGPINGNFNAKCTVEPTPPDNIKIVIDGGGAGSKMRLALSLKLEKKSDKLTSVNWEAQADITGLVSGLGENMLRQLSSTKITDIINALKKRIV